MRGKFMSALWVMSLGAILAVGAPVAVGASEDDTDQALLVSNNPKVCPDAQFTTIQSAVAAAAPGSKILVCPGTYREMVTVATSAKNGLRIVAAGGADRVIIEGEPDNPHSGPEAGFLLNNVSGVLIEGFMVRGFHEADIVLRGADGNTIRKNRTTKSAHDGIQLNNSSGNVIEHNVSFDNDAPLPARAFTDACGILLRMGSSNNVIRHNELFGNAFGILIVSDGNTVSENYSHDNRRYGIRNLNNSGTLIHDNRVEGNHVSDLGPGRGIAVEGSSGVTVSDNEAFDNTPDLFWDGLGSNTFEDNQCDTSQPPGLCEHDE